MQLKPQYDVTRTGQECGNQNMNCIVALAINVTWGIVQADSF